MNMRIGHGYDVHRLVEGRRCIIGGVDIPFELGLDGHSDADVLTHAVMDALLGALARCFSADYWTLFASSFFMGMGVAALNANSAKLLRLCRQYRRNRTRAGAQARAAYRADARKPGRRDGVRRGLRFRQGDD